MAGYPVRQSMMNLSKNLYVFMLALLMVASGCLGGGSSEPLTPGEEEGEVEDGPPALIAFNGTFPTPGVVNSTFDFDNYYWPITNISTNPLYGSGLVARGGAVELKRSDICVTSVEPGSSTSVTRCASNQLYLRTQCSNGEYVVTVAVGGGFFPGAGMYCTHQIQMRSEHLAIVPDMNITDGRYSILLVLHEVG